MRTVWTLQEADIGLQTGNETETVLRRLSLRIGEGECIAVVGRNGSGKSTLLRALGGLAIAPVTGGKLVREQDEELLVRMVFQNPDAQLVGETVYEDIGFGLENRAVPPQQMPGRVRSALAAVGLDVPPDRPVESLSGGQKQLLCIAAALATGAQVLLLDEPTSMLDPEAKREVLRVMGRLHREGATIVWTTQAMDEIGSAGRVIALQDGGVAFDGTPERFLYGSEGDAAGSEETCPCLKVGLRLPYAVQVARRLLRSGIMLSARPVDNGGLLKAVAYKWR